MLLSDVETVEGIGPAYGEALRARGIGCPLDLRLSAAKWPQLIADGVPETLLARWVRMADLFRVAGMTADMAECLVDAGIHNVEKLSEAGLRTLETAQRRAVEARRMPAELSRYALADLIREAWRARSSALAHGSLVDPTGAPIPEAVVVLGFLRVKPRAADGRFVLPSVPVPDARYAVELGTTRLMRGRLRLAAGALHAMGKITANPARAGTERVVREGRGFRFPPPASGTARETIERESVEEGRFFVYRKTLASGIVRLLALDRTLRGTRMVLHRMDVPPEELDGEPLGRDSIFLFTGGKLLRQPLTRREFEEQRFRGTLGFQPPDAGAHPDA